MRGRQACAHSNRECPQEKERSWGEEVYRQLKISSVACGMIPRDSSLLKPSMVYVLPVPVCPYAMMVAL